MDIAMPHSFTWLLKLSVKELRCLTRLLGGGIFLLCQLKRIIKKLLFT